MRTSRSASATASLAVLVLLGACSGGSDPAPPPPAAGGTTGGQASTPAPSGSQDGGARTLPIPEQGLPPGHPPIDATAQGVPDAPAKPTGVTWDVPDHWVVEPPSNTVRLAQYRVPGPGGDGECIVFYFGPGQGGDALANARRWAGQFTQPDGRSSADLMKVSALGTAKVPVQLVEVGGTYDGGMSGSGSQAGYALLGGIAEGRDAPWFFKFVGPEATVRAERDAFVRMMESLRADG